MANWTNFDFFILLLFAVNMFLGMSRGATKEIIYMMCLSLALIFTVKFTVTLTVFFNSSPLITDVITSNIVRNFMAAIGAPPLTIALLKEIAFSISMLVCFFVPYSIAAGAIAIGGFVESFSFPYATLNRKIGGALGFVRGYVYTLIVLVIMTLHIFNNTDGVGSDIYRNSYFANLFRGATQTFNNVIISQNPEKYREIFRDKNLFTPDQVLKGLSQDDNPVMPAPAASDAAQQ